jgi:CheY-like chemotaxis protein
METILVIDDVQDHFELLDDALGQQYQLLHATDALEGMRLALLTQPALILLDIGLPRLDARTFVCELRSREAIARTPVVAVTAYAMPGDRERCLAAGCDDYLSKPVDVNRIADRIERWIDCARARDCAAASAAEPASRTPAALQSKYDVAHAEILNRSVLAFMHPEAHASKGANHAH